MSTAEELGIKSVRILTEKCEDGTERWMNINNAYDLTSHPKNYGIHGAELVFGMQRGEVTVVLRWMTPFHLLHVRQRLNGKKYLGDLFDGLGSIDYHSKHPHYEGQTPIANCTYTGGKCYFDGSGLAASELFDRAVADPEEIWKTLKKWLEDAERGSGQLHSRYV